MINARIDLSPGFKTLAVDLPSIVRQQVGYAALRTTDVLAKMVKEEVDKEMASTFHKPTRFTMSAIKYYHDDREMSVLGPSGVEAKTSFSSHVTLIREGMLSKWSKASTIYGVTAVEYGDAWEKALTHQFGGGQRRFKPFEGALLKRKLIKPGYIAVPAAGCPLDAYDNPQKGFMVQLLSYFDAFPEKGYKANMGQKGRKKFENTLSKKMGGALQTGFFIAYGKMGMAPSEFRNVRNYQRLPAGIWQRFHGGLNGGTTIRPVFIFVRSPAYTPLIDFREIATWTFDSHIKDVFSTQLQKAILTSKAVRKATGG